MKTVLRYTLILTPLLLASCHSKLRFDGMSTFEKSEVTIENPSLQPPEEPPVIPEVPEEEPKEPEVPPVPEPVYKKTSGTCSPDSSTSVASCLKCEVPPLPPVEPPMSLKARQLMKIMTEGCGIYNKSYDRNYIPPAAAAHLAKLNRCSPTAYKDTTPTKPEADLLARLMNDDTALYQRMFGGLWYQPPYSDHFEKYFGVEVREAVQVFCTQKNANFTGNLYPIEWYNSENPDSFKMPKAYVDANKYRTELKSCLHQSVVNPWKPTGPAPVQKVCNFETIEGEAGEAIQTQITTWLAKGYKVGAEIKNQGLCLEVSDVTQLNSFQGDILVGGYVCQ